MKTSTVDRLLRLRVWFVAYFVFSLVVGTWVSFIVVESLHQSPSPNAADMEQLAGGPVIACSLFIGCMMFGLALLLFHELLKSRNWARVIMLVIAWLTAVSSLLGILSSLSLFSPSRWLLHLLPGPVWEVVALTSLVSDVVSLVFSVYMIRTLQYNLEIRSEFMHLGHA